MDDKQKNDLIALIEKFSSGEGIHDTVIPGMKCIRMSDLNMRLPTVYNPSVCVIAQGRKQVLLEDDLYQYAPSQYLMISVDLPVIGQVTEATREKPYLCLQIDIDVKQLSDLMVKAPLTARAEPATGRGLFVGQVDQLLGDSVLRLARLLETPQDIPVLAPLAVREIHYRLLSGQYGAMIAQLAIKGSNLQRIAAVIHKLKSDFDKPISVDQLAEIAGMSLSSFHAHFKKVTAMSPLQYQKRLRLTEARQIMLTDALDAASTAYRVGYDSPSQFSREYARLFGAPPVRDVAKLRLSASI
ncbi:AraC family transcriptional regulator [Emcibacter sp.]|uniref:AraC family transcriptional regulator n=1 Tax=Emcibacter sp. TaxID=1979954 RepID=UPI003A9230AD